MSAMNSLEEVLDESRPRIEAALSEAEAELDEVRQRERELLVLIHRAHAVLGLSSNLENGDSGRLTLHEAIEKVLREHGSSMTVHELADEINARGLYAMRDGRPVAP